MTDTTSVPADAAAPEPKGFVGRLFGIIFSPRATYADVAARPQWLGVALVVLAVGAAGIFAFLSTDVGQQAMLDQQYRMMDSMKSMGLNIPQAAYDRMEQGVTNARYTGAAGSVATFSIAALVIAAVALVVFNAIMGGDATFKQLFAVVVHSGVIIMARQLFGLPLAYARQTLSGTTNLAVFAPFLDESSFAARALGSIDLFTIWWIVSLAIGFGVLYKRRTQPIAVSLIALYVAIGLIIAAVQTALAGA